MSFSSQCTLHHTLTSHWTLTYQFLLLDFYMGHGSLVIGDTCPIVLDTFCQNQQIIFVLNRTEVCMENACLVSLCIHRDLRPSSL